MKRKELWISIAVLLLLIGLPYLLATWSGGNVSVFSGFLLNPTDGNSYLAKMYEGWNGSWQFKLPYTADPGNGSYLFLFYLFLGHVARWIGLSLILTFHLARIFAAIFLVFSLVVFLGRIFKDHPQILRLATWLAVFGSGMGWLVILFGLIPSDFWVAETYPFLSMYDNPHFPLGLALLLSILSISFFEKHHVRNLVLLALMGFLESMIFPFALVVVAMILATGWAWNWLEARGHQRVGLQAISLPKLVATLIFGGPFLLYQFWISSYDPVLAGWNAQNITPSPDLWDFALSLSPALPLAFWGAWILWKEHDHPGRKVLLSWFVPGLLLIYTPFSLQRRFMLGFYIPTVALAGIGAFALADRFHRVKWTTWLVGLSLPTNLFLLIAAMIGVLSHATSIYLTRDEYLALDWIQRSTPSQALVIAAPETGNWIPAWSGRRVIYGHPFETVNAKTEEQSVKSFFSGEWDADRMNQFMELRKVDYIIFGPRERLLALTKKVPELPEGINAQAVFKSGDVTIYARKAAP